MFALPGLAMPALADNGLERFERAVKPQLEFEKLRLAGITATTLTRTKPESPSGRQDAAAGEVGANSRGSDRLTTSPLLVGGGRGPHDGREIKHGEDLRMFESIGIAWAPRLLSILRFVSGLTFMSHGVAKLLKYPPLPVFAKLELFSLLGFAGVLELAGGALLILGLFTRPVAFILSGEMAFAYFMAHAPRNYHPLLNGGEAAILFCFIFLYIAAAGPGPWSVDAARKK